MANEHCLIPGRNFCAPEGKIAALFVDIDGTISVCEPYFRAAKRRFAQFMTQCGFDGEDARKRAQLVEIAYIERHGFQREALGKSFIKVYGQLCKEKGIKRERWIADICRDIGGSPFFFEPKLFDDAAAVLARANHNFFIIAVSIGNREAQKYKIRQAGLATVFDDMIITYKDNKLDLVRQVIEDLNIDPRYSAFIGNSPRSDGACLKATNFIYLPMEPGWSFDNAQLPKGTGFQTFQVDDWREAEEQGINRLIRQRKTAMDTSGNDPDAVCCQD